MANISQIKLPDNSTYNIKAIGLASQAKTISNVAIASFSDGADNVPVASLIVDIDAVQDLHGQEYPYPAGGGKNLLKIKDDFTYNQHGITISLIKDNDNNILGLDINGTADSNIDCYPFVSMNLPQDTYYITTSLTQEFAGFQMVETPDYVGIKTNAVFTNKAVNSCYIGVASGTVFNHLKIYPMVCLNSVSDKSFAPYSNVCPINGWSECHINKNGINQWDEVWEVGSINDSGVNAIDANRIRSKNYIPIIPNTDYFIACPSTTKNGKAFFYDNNQTFISSAWFYGNAPTTSPANAYYMRFRMVDAYGTTYNNDISINYPATDTDYHAYNGTTYNIPFGQTVYGGSLNVSTGLLTITHGIVTYSSNDGFIEHSSGRFYKNELPDNCDYLDGASSISNVATYADTRENGAYFVFGSSGIYVNKLTPSETLSDLNTRLSTTPMDIVYPLATPTTVQLTPTEVRTLLGNNNIFADTGNINELVYFKTGCESITELIDVMHDDSKMSYSNVYYKKTCNQLTDPGIYYNIDTTGSPAEGYTMTALITTYNCQILVYLGLVVNIRRVNHIPGGGISFSPWKRLANEDDLDGAVIPYNAEYPSLGTIYDVIESIRSPSTQTVTLAANSWDSSTHLITVSVTGVTSTSVQDVIGLPATSSANISNNEALQDANIMDAGQSTGSLTFYAETVPTTDLQIRVIVRG